MDVVAAILVYENKIISFKRGYAENEEISFKYEFPGGKVKENEGLKKALRRELKEELNIEIGELFFFFKNSFSYSRFDVLLHFYIAKLDLVEFKLKSHIEYKIIEIENLKSLEWLAGDYPVINYMEKNLRSFYKPLN